MQSTPETVGMSADVNDHQYYGDTYVLVPTGTGLSFTGLTPPPTPYEEIKFIISAGYSITLVHDSAASSAGNRLYLRDPSVPGATFTGIDRTLMPGVPYWLVYDPSGVKGAGWYGEGTAA